MGAENTTFILPSYWASALINGDYSGLDETETQQVKDWEKTNSEYYVVECGEQYFSSYNDATNLAGDVCDFTAIHR